MALNTHDSHQVKPGFLWLIYLEFSDLGNWQLHDLESVAPRNATFHFYG